jgi:hypothetical protein
LDIGGFMAPADHLASSEVIALLAEYQSRLIPIIQKRGRVRPAGATIRLHQLSKQSRKAPIGIDGRVTR